MLDQKAIDKRADEMTERLREAREECLFKTGYTYGFEDALRGIIEVCEELLGEDDE